MHWRLPRAWQLALASHVLAALLLPAADTLAVLGLGSETSQLAAVVSVTGLVFDGQLTWVATGLTTFKLTAASGIDETSVLGASGVLRHRRCRAPVGHRLTHPTEPS